MAVVEQPHIEVPGRSEPSPADTAIVAVNSATVPLSFPAILRNSKLSSRFAHLHLSSQYTSPPPRRTNKDRLELEGKRWIRRRENAKFAHNPHIAHPTNVDYANPLQVPSSTFPYPLPSYLPRNIPIPPSHPPPNLPSTSAAGLFSLSLKGARRTLRSRPSSAPLVKAIESHLTTWLEGGTYLNPDEGKGFLSFPGEAIGDREDIREVGREAGRLVWAVKSENVSANPGYGDGGFERYVVHCIARWYGIVSFSKETHGHRLTFLLRPNVTRPDPRTNFAARSLDTPPTTDVSDFHVSDVALSDFNDTTDGSEYSPTDVSDIDSIASDRPAGLLSDIEGSRPSSPASWSDIGGSDFQIYSIHSDDDDADEQGFAASMESLSLSTHSELDDSAPAAEITLTPSRLRTSGISECEDQEDNDVSPRARHDQNPLHSLYSRSPSSPSPVRRSTRRPSTSRKMGRRRSRGAKKAQKGFAGAIGGDKSSFYDYLFA